MSERMKPILGALVAGFAINFVGVTYLFGPMIAEDVPGEPMLPAWASLLVISTILVLFYDWVAQAVGHPIQAAMIVAISQILLVDVYYVLNGTRGLAAAGASAVVLLVGWGVIGTVYGKLSDGGTAAA